MRREDLAELEGRLSFIVCLWDAQSTPLVLPFAEYEDVFRSVTPARDSQYKVQVLLGEDSTQLYIARAGRFTVDTNLGWTGIERSIGGASSDIPPLSHGQVQTLLGAIGVLRDFDVWIPQHDRNELDWSVTDRFRCLGRLPYAETTCALLNEIDTIWMHRGSTEIAALYEIEHATPVYSGLLRLNDLHLALPSAQRLAVVSNEARRSLFVRQLRRPTFQRSGLSDVCTFLEYTDVFDWHRRIQTRRSSGSDQSGLDRENEENR